MRYFSSIATPKTLSSSISDSATSIALNNITGLPGAFPYTLVIEPDTANEEIVSVTANPSGSNLTIVRAQDSSSPVAHVAGVAVRHMITARDVQEPQTHMNSTTSVHGIPDTSVLATTSAVTAAVAAHEADTTGVHGIADTSQLALSSNVVSRTNGSVTTASTSATVVRNITVSTSDPSAGSDGDVWLKYV